MTSPSRRPLSHSLPITGAVALKGERVRNFFDDLHSDSQAIWLRVATQFKTDGAETFDLLRAISRNCVGDAQLLSEGESPADVQSIMGTALSVSEIESLLIQTTRSGPMGSLEDEEDQSISLAGAQEKTALLWHQGQWMRPHRGHAHDPYFEVAHRHGGSPPG